MKIIAVNGSPRIDGNTQTALNIMNEIFEKHEIELEILNIGTSLISGCRACDGCAKMQNKKCVIDDRVNSDIEKMESADGIILATPVYFAGVTGTMKSFLDRVFFVSTMNGNLFRHKVGASLAISRRDGGICATDTLDYYLRYSEMFLATSNYWTSAYGAIKGELAKDKEGLQIFRLLAENFVYLLKMRNAVEKNEPTPKRELKIMTNFIR